ncbi:MAG: hypothetical protein HKP08_00585 [Flavobacteriaceae bacterium]|nr:hypothetical protein [Flavobacteriaceae bacterium]
MKKEDLKHLNGYWEISEVEFPSGDKKQYEMSATVDYFEVSDMSGYRKKVQPLANSKYITSDDAEKFQIEPRQDVYIIMYQNEMSAWEEEIESLSATSLILKNNEQIRYIYKRYEPLTFE